MRITLDPDDRLLLIVSGILLVAISVGGALAFPRTTSGPSAYPSTYSRGSTGAKAAYMLLGKLGYQEERWNSPPSLLPQKSRNVTLIFANPFERASSEEKTAIESFVQRGGRVLATGALGASLLNLRGFVPVKQPDLDWEKFNAQLPGPISWRAPDILMQAWIRWKDGEPGDLQYYGDHRGGIVVRFRLGGGTIIWWADASPLNNYGLTRASNLELLLNSVGEARRVRLLWDEYFHGDRPDLWSYLDKTPLPWAMIQVAILALALIFTYSRRSGPVIAPAKASRLSPMEFVETVGGLYQRKHAAQGAVEIALHRFRLLLARRQASSAKAINAGMERVSLRGSGEEAADLAQFLSQCATAVKTGISDEAQALKIVQKLHDYACRLRLAGPGE